MAQTNLPKIPEFITVHLGKPNEIAENVQVSFPDYIKNVASSEIFPTWPENAIRANIYAQVTFALNRIYTEWYRSRGYNFDITNSTQFDQKFVYQREIFENVSQLVDELFNNYVVKDGSVEPFFTEFCDGKTVQCKGLSQWGTVELANQGKTPFEILQYYYGDNINIIKNAPVQNIPESYPGVPLKIGSAGNNVRAIQISLNRISQNYPAIPKIPETTGLFGILTENAVKKFQEVFSLPATGVVDKATWYKIKYIFNSVKRLAELSSEGLKFEEVEYIFSESLQEGDQNTGVKYVQYYLSVVGYYNPQVPIVPITGIFGPQTKLSVESFQKAYGLPITGIVNQTTWNVLSQTYESLLSYIPADYFGRESLIFPGRILSKGMRGEDVRKLQNLLIFIADTLGNISRPSSATGFYGDTTLASVIDFQRQYGINPTGVVGITTWTKIAEIYAKLKGIV